jgi:hypothetical protein
LSLDEHLSQTNTSRVLKFCYWSRGKLEESITRVWPVSDFAFVPQYVTVVGLL